MPLVPATEHRIFLVDDHPLFRMGLKSLLQSDQRFVICGEARDSASALSALSIAEADIVIIDMELGPSCALELLKQIKTAQPLMKALLLCQHDDDQYLERALRLGATGYIRKDAPVEEVIESIVRVLRGGLALSAQSSELILRRVTSCEPSSDSLNLSLLSNRELEIFQLLGQGGTTRECSVQLGISVKTVEAHLAGIRTKLGLKGINQLRRHAVLWCSKGKGRTA